MYQQSLDLQFPLTQQLSLGFPYEKMLVTTSPSLAYMDSQLSLSATTNSGLSVTQLQVTESGLYIRQENKSWLKTKVANWLGVKYL